MQLTVYRGTREVGGTCIELSTKRSRLILDVGLPLFDADREPLDSFQLRRMEKDDLLAKGILPCVSGLFEGGPAPDAILLSHAHLDHIGDAHLFAKDVQIIAHIETRERLERYKDPHRPIPETSFGKNYSLNLGGI